jgi:hypothetical protein
MLIYQRMMIDDAGENEAFHKAIQYTGVVYQWDLDCTFAPGFSPFPPVIDSVVFLEGKQRKERRRKA